MDKAAESTIQHGEAATAPEALADAVTLIAIPEVGAAPGPVRLEVGGRGDCAFVLECLQGADAIHLEIAVGGRTRLRAEVRAHPGERVRFGLNLDPSGEPALEAGSHRIFFLPLESEYRPLPPIPARSPESGDRPWDICLVVDATARTCSVPGESPGHGAVSAERPWAADGLAQVRALDAFLLDRPEQWGSLVEALVEIVRQLGQRGGCRIAVIAYGDESPAPGVYATDLTPAYHLRHLPDDRPEHLPVPMAPEDLSALLKGIDATPGADFVDALADALTAASRLQWGDEAHRLVLAVGDSPGHAAAHPVPSGGDALARRNDLDAAAARLHRDRVEILTLYHPPPEAVLDALLPKPRELLRYAKIQYGRLASHAGLALTTGELDPARAVAALTERSAPLGRGACWGRFVGDG